MTSFPVRITAQGSGSGFTALEGPHISSRFQTNQGTSPGCGRKSKWRARQELGAPVLCLLQRWKYHGKCKEKRQSHSASGYEKSINTWAKQRPLGGATPCRRQENHSPGVIPQLGTELVSQTVQKGSSMTNTHKIIHEQTHRGPSMNKHTQRAIHEQTERIIHDQTHRRPSMNTCWSHKRTRDLPFSAGALRPWQSSGCCSAHGSWSWWFWGRSLLSL